MGSKILSVTIGVFFGLVTFMVYDLSFNHYNNKWLFSANPTVDEYYLCSRGYNDMGGEYLSKVLQVSSDGKQVKTLSVNISYLGGDLLQAMVVLDNSSTNILVFQDFLEKLRIQATLIEHSNQDREVLQSFTRAINNYSATLYAASVDNVGQYKKRCKPIKATELKRYWH